MTSFTLTPAEKGILRCRHAAPFSPQDVQALAKFFEDYHGKLLVDLTQTTSNECASNIKQLRPMMPTTAIFGAELDPSILAVADSYYTHPVRHFANEQDALAWLREQ
jgi:hypothetical protein